MTFVIFYSSIFGNTNQSGGTTVASIKDIKRGMLNGVIKDLSMTPQKKELNANAHAIVITALQEKGSEAYDRIIIRQDSETARWTQANKPADVNVEPSGIAMLDRQKTRRNQYNKTWGLPLEP
jgi:hypothetical protein